MFKGEHFLPKKGMYKAACVEKFSVANGQGQYYNGDIYGEERIKVKNFIKSKFHIYSFIPHITYLGVGFMCVLTCARA